MARMRVISIGQWGDGGIQVNCQMVPVPSGGRYEVNHTEMSMPDNAVEFDRLMAIRMYEKYDIEGTKAATL